MNYSRVASFKNIQEVYLASSFLENNRIKTRILNENTSQAFGIITDPLGGIGLEVPTLELKRAYDLLIQEGIIDDKESEEYKIVKRVGEISENWPLLNRISPILRILVIVTFVIGIFLTLIAYAFPRTKKPMSEWEMEYKYFPVLDTLNESNPSLAISSINKLIEKYPTNANLWNYKGIAYSYMDSFNLSYESFLKSKEYAPSFETYPDYNMGWVKLDQKEFDKAIEHFHIASSKDSSLLFDLGWAYELNGEIGNSIRSYTLILNSSYVKAGRVVGNEKDYKYLVNRIDSLRQSQHEN